MGNIRFMSNNLIIFGANNKECEAYILFHRDEYPSYTNIIIASHASKIQGLYSADILFLRSWWSRISSREILAVLESYIFSSNESRVVGDRDYLPPYLIDKYINKFPDKERYINDKINNRFEILDIR